MQDASRPGRPRTARESANEQEVVRVTLEETPQGATHWSTRTLAAHLDSNATAVAGIWREHGLKPHHVGSFKRSNDPRFIEKLEDKVAQHASAVRYDREFLRLGLETLPVTPMNAL